MLRTAFISRPDSISARLIIHSLPGVKAIPKSRAFLIASIGSVTALRTNPLISRNPANVPLHLGPGCDRPEINSHFPYAI